MRGRPAGAADPSPSHAPDVEAISAASGAAAGGSAPSGAGNAAVLLVSCSLAALLARGSRLVPAGLAAPPAPFLGRLAPPG